MMVAEDLEKHSAFGVIDVDDHDDDSNHRSFGGGGNRWPRQETLALLKIRSDMDASFRDSTLKAPLWDHISRKLGELGYERSAKKCKEKFENVYKYHRRTKEGRSGKPEGKTYRFFEELEAFDHQQNSHNLSQSAPIIHSSTKIDSLLLPNHVQSSQDNANGFHKATNLFSVSTSSATDSDEEFRKKRKRKWKYFFRGLTKKILKKQERLQETFLEAISKSDKELFLKEEAWRMQEMARLNREHEALVHERATAAAKDAALLQFLNKASLQHKASDIPSVEINDAAAMLAQSLPVLPLSWAIDQRDHIITSSDTALVAPRNLEAKKVYGNGTRATNFGVIGSSSSRWPKTEVEALIDLRISLDMKYHDIGAKGSIWEEISAGMRRHGYERSAKRCKEKWENINKYFKKVKERCNTRPEDSKTCPYFHRLEAMYKNKNKNNNNIELYKDSSVEKLQVVMPPLRENVDQNQEEEEEHDDHGEEGESNEEGHHVEHDDQMGIVTSYKPSSMEMVES